MCTLRLYALYSIVTPLLLTSIFHSYSRLLIHACSEALRSHIFCIFVVLSFYAPLYFRSLWTKAVWPNPVDVDVSYRTQTEHMSNSVTLHTG